MIAHHIAAQVSLVRDISWSSHDERGSSTLSPPFSSTSSSSHSSFVSCTSEPVHSAWKEMDSLDDSYLLTSSIQKNVMDAMVKKIAMDVSNQRMTNALGNHRATEIVNWTTSAN